MLLKLNLDSGAVLSESAKAPSYKFARVSGKAELVLPSSKRAALTEIKTHLKQAKSDRTKALRVAAQHEKAVAAAEKASTPERKKALKAKAKTLKGQASALNKTAKAALSAANKSARSHGLGGLKLPVNTDILASAKKLAKADLTAFGADGKRGQFKPKFAPDSKFDDLGTSTVTKAAKKAPVKIAKKEAAPITRMKGATGAHSPAKEKQAREQGLMGSKRKTTRATGPTGGGRRSNVAAGANKGNTAKLRAEMARAKRLGKSDVAASGEGKSAASTKAAATRYAMKPDADLTKMEDADLSSAFFAVQKKARGNVTQRGGVVKRTPGNPAASARLNDLEREMSKRKLPMSKPALRFDRS